MKTRSIKYAKARGWMLFLVLCTIYSALVLRPARARAENAGQDSLSDKALSVDQWMTLAAKQVADGKPEDALQSLANAADKEDRATMPASRAMAELAFKLEKYSLAAVVSQRIYRRHPDKMVGVRTIEALAKSKEFDAARAMLEEVKGRSGSDEVIAVLASRIERQAGNKALAMSMLDRAVEAFPQAAFPLVERGSILQAEADPMLKTRGVADQIKARQVEPGPPAGLRAAAAAANAAELAAMEAQVLEYVRANPMDAASGWYEIAMVRQQMGKFAQSRQAFEEGIKLDPGQAMPLNNFAYMLATDLNDAKAALPLAQRAVALAPDDGDIVDTLGYAQFGMNQLDEAEESFRQSLALQPQAAPLVHLAMVRTARNDTLGARVYLLEAKKLLDGADDQTKEHYAQALSALAPKPATQPATQPK